MYRRCVGRWVYRKVLTSLLLTCLAVSISALVQAGSTETDNGVCVYTFSVPRDESTEGAGTCRGRCGTSRLEEDVGTLKTTVKQQQDQIAAMMQQNAAMLQQNSALSQTEQNLQKQITALMQLVAASTHKFQPPHTKDAIQNGMNFSSKEIIFLILDD